MRMLPVLTALPLVVAFGIVEGRWTNRWSSALDTEQAAARLVGIPSNIGDWVGTDEQLDPRQVARGEIVGYLLRRYTHWHNGRTVSVLLVCGSPGPTSLHTPEVCFPASGYNEAAMAERQRVTSSGLDKPAEFWVARFQKGSEVAEPLRIHWAWNAAGDWLAPDHPRFVFGRYPSLYKLYVTCPLARPEETGPEDVSTEFLAVFLPEVQKNLFP